MKKPKETPPAATEGAQSNATGSDELSASNSEAHEAMRSTFSIPQPAGLLGDLATYFYDSARYPMLEGATLAALGLMAGVAGRAFNFEGTGLNLYLLLLAESGRGKEDMARGIERVLSAGRAKAYPPNALRWAGDDFVGPRKFASGQALNRALASTPCFLSIQSEFGLRLKELNDPRAPASTSELRLSLLDLYAKSGKGDTFRATAYADREKDTQIVKAPAISILGESTPGHVFDNLSFRDIEDGLLPRTLVMEASGDRPPTNSKAYSEVPDEIANRFANLVTTVMQIGGSDSHPIEPRQVVASEGGASLLNAIQDKFDADFNDKSRDAFDRALWNRAGLNIRRIAGLIAVGCMPGQHSTPVIEREHVDWAYKFVAHCVGTLAGRFREGMVGTGETRQEAELKRYMVEYVQMKPSKRQFTYSVPQKIADEAALITLGYLRRRAKQCTAFTQDRRGFNVALHSTMDALVRAGVMARMPALSIQQRYGLTCEVYAFSNGEDTNGWREARRPRR